MTPPEFIFNLTENGTPTAGATTPTATTITTPTAGATTQTATTIKTIGSMKFGDDTGYILNKKPDYVFSPIKYGN